VCGFREAARSNAPERFMATESERSFLTQELMDQTGIVKSQNRRNPRTAIERGIDDPIGGAF
jgi:hypothetical protein